MLKKLTQRELIENLTADWQPRFRAAFIESINEIVSQITLALVIERLERGDVPGAIDALNIERAAFGNLAIVTADAFNAGGIAVVGGMPNLRQPDGAKAVLRFDVRDPAAEAWVREHSATLITGLTDEARESARVTIEGGMSEGQGPRQIARSLAGSVNRATGRREGGQIGLTSAQVRQWQKARSQLISGDPAQLGAFMDRNLRDKRLDRTIRKAINAGKSLDAATAGKMLNRLSANMLRYRATVIARTETMEAMESSQHEAYRQTMARLGLNPATDVEKEWRATSGERTRDTHMALHGQTVTGLETPFVSFSGARLRYPGDRSLGAPASELVQCRCHPIYRLRFERALR